MQKIRKNKSQLQLHSYLLKFAVISETIRDKPNRAEWASHTILSIENVHG